MSETTHRVLVRVPRDASSISSMRVVVGWVGSCNDAALDQLDDINLALETLVAADAGVGGELSLTVAVEQGVMHLVLGGLKGSGLRANLESSHDFSTSPQWPLDLNIFFAALLDKYEVLSGDSDDFAVSMVKGI